MKRGKITLVRTAVGSPAAMSLINELRKRGIRVVGTDCNPLSAGLYECDKGYLVPRGDDPRFLEATLKICDAEKPEAFLSGPEEEILALSRNKDQFREKGVLVICPDYDTVKTCVDKVETHNAFRRCGVPVPAIYDEDNVEFPCIIKPRFGRGGKGFYFVNDATELNLLLKRVENPVIQEFLSGEEYTIDIFSDMKGNPLSIVPRVRLQVESGISVKGMTIYDEEIIRYCRRIAEELRLLGPSCIQCIKDEKGEARFTEINPRFGGGSILSIQADQSIIPNLIRIAKGENAVPSEGFQQGLIMLRYYSETFLAKDRMIGNIPTKADDHGGCHL